MIGVSIRITATIPVTIVLIFSRTTVNAINNNDLCRENESVGKTYTKINSTYMTYSISKIKLL